MRKILENFQKFQKQSIRESALEKKQRRHEILTEISRRYLDAMEDWIAQAHPADYSFDDLFGGAMRVVVPMLTTIEEIETIKQVLSSGEKARADIRSPSLDETIQFNWAKGTVIYKEEFTIPKGPKAGEVVKRNREEKIGKILNKLAKLQERINARAMAATVGAENDNEHEALLDEFEKYAAPRYTHMANRLSEYWHNNSEHIMNNPEVVTEGTDTYSIVVSRHPIDVLRMSDFQNIHSCHSEGNDYFHCAIVEAKGNGPIAYAVLTEDLNEFLGGQSIKAFDAQEVFNDKPRFSKGINPFQRVRIRKYVANEDSQNEKSFAVPEQQTYGKRIPSFLKTVAEWLRKEQPTETLPIFGSLVMYGGSYRDRNDGDLLNAFFDVDIYPSTNVPNALEDEEDEEDGNEALFDQWADQVADIDNDANNRASYVSFWSDVDDDGEGNPWVSYGSNTLIRIPVVTDEEVERFNLKEIEGNHYNSDFMKALDEIFSDVFPVTIGDIEFMPRDSSVRMSFDTDGEDPDPDGYENYVEWIISEVDEEFDSIVAKTYKELRRMRFLPPSPRDEHFPENDIDEEYEYLVVEYDDSKDTIEISLREMIPIPIGKVTYSRWYRFKNWVGNGDVISVKMAAEIGRYLANRYNQLLDRQKGQMTLDYGSDYEEKTLADLDSLKWEKYLATNVTVDFNYSSPDVDMDILIVLPADIDENLIEPIKKMIGFLDNDRVLGEAIRKAKVVFDSNVKDYVATLAPMEQPKPTGIYEEAVKRVLSDPKYKKTAKYLLERKKAKKFV